MNAIIAGCFAAVKLGIANHLARRQPRIGSAEFGKSFEHFILMELKAYQAYRQPELDIRFGRTASGFEVDFVLGALGEELHVRRAIAVSLERQPRTVSPGIEILPWRIFLGQLWNGDLGV